MSTEEVLTADLPKDLEAHVQTIRAFAHTHNMLVKGHYNYPDFAAVDQCVQFLKTLHGQAIRVAAEHEDADMVPELKAFKEDERAKNGEA